MTCYDLYQYKIHNHWIVSPTPDLTDVMTFNQQYYTSYVGGQLRSQIYLLRHRVDVTFQGDWGYVCGYNIDSHLLRGERYSTDSTYGGAWHLAMIAEMPISSRFSVGVRADHTEIRTTGSHHLVDPALHIDQSWSNGVSDSSDQTSITAFFRLSI
jgi:hypothetical protein